MFIRRCLWTVGWSQSCFCTNCGCLWKPTVFDIGTVDFTRFSLPDAQKLEALTSRYQPSKGWKVPLRDFGKKSRRVPDFVFDESFYPFFSSPEPSGSQGELIVYPYSGVRCRRCRCRQQCLNIFSSETALPIKAKFYVEPPWEGGTKVYINGPGHMTKMAAMPIYGKNL